MARLLRLAGHFQLGGPCHFPTGLHRIDVGTPATVNQGNFPNHVQQLIQPRQVGLGLVLERVRPQRCHVSVGHAIGGGQATGEQALALGFEQGLVLPCLRRHAAARPQVECDVDAL
jgi:hypothetical protein